jgi:hypothetical protein
MPVWPALDLGGASWWLDVVNESSRGERWRESTGGTRGCVREACGAPQVDSSEDASSRSPGAQVWALEGEPVGC